jgi:hypothetical protein
MTNGPSSGCHSSQWLLSQQARKFNVPDLTAFPPLLKWAFALDSPDLRPIPDSGPHDRPDFVEFRYTRGSPTSDLTAPSCHPHSWALSMRIPRKLYIDSPSMIRIGTSSWADPEFVRDWYPPKLPASGRLGWYAKHFD